MIITLQNFKIWSDKTFDLGEKGITLLSGKSGVGKTSILEAIIFAITGKGSKIKKYNSKSCKVVLEIDDKIIITRTKSPNILTLNEKCDNIILEDDIAQDIINKKFGQYFDLVSYIQQNSQKSFIMLSPTEKLVFLENFAFQDIELASIKKKLKNLHRERNDKLITTTSKLEMISTRLDNFNRDDMEIVEFPIKCSSKNRERYIKNNKIKIKNNKILRKRYSKKLEKLLEELQNQIKITQYIDLKQQELNKTEDEISHISDKLEKIGNIDVIINKHESLSNTLKMFLQQSSIQLLKTQLNDAEKQYKELYQSNQEKINNRIKEIETVIWNDASKEEVIQIITDYKVVVNDYNEYTRLITSLEKLPLPIENLQKNINNINDQLLSLKMSKTVLMCPKCDTTLSCSNGVLHFCEIKKYDTEETEDKLRKKLLKYEKQYKQQIARESIEKSIQEIVNMYEDGQLSSECIDDFNEYKQYYNNNLLLEKERENLLKSSDNDMLKELKKSIKKKKIKIDKLIESQTTEIIDINEEKTRDQINTLSITIDNHKKYAIQLTKYNNDKESIIKSIENKKISDRDIQHETDDMKVKINELEKKLEELEEIKEYLDKYTRYREKQDEIDNVLSHKQELEDKEIDDTTRLNSSDILTNIIKKAEAIAIQNIINNINIYVRTYIDIFFSDEPMTIELHPFKSDKKGNKKPQINLYIYYKEMECDINTLSGGELQRVIVAFSLALSEMYNTPFILLDECTSNLDQDSTNAIISGIKSQLGDKLVILIAHQVVSGIFDKTINICV
jgi:DNA repair exonuclease SbcCD ATPase subunit